MYEIFTSNRVMDHSEVGLTDKCILEIQREPISSVDSLEEVDIYGHPSISPRIGDEYQVELPPLMTETEYLQLIQNQKQNHKVGTIVHDYAIRKELHIPVVWIPGEAYQTNVEMKDSVKTTHVGSTNNQSTDLKNVSWTDAEVDSFLLGLYIFGKNFTPVHKFMEGNNVGDVLSFYYGKFYRSAAHRRWLECKKLRSRRCISGNRLFSGWRQHELLSRLLHKVPEQSQGTLKEAVMNFNDGMASLEELVFKLKRIVGLHTLTEAIAVGKGKHDLTRVTTHPLEANNMQSLRPEISKGKSFCSLTSEDIITYLTGNFRLSKMQLSDLFWESVWPLLLARGWHSELPNSRGFITSHKSLVFLFPGVKKFSRRELVKGTHYFDSVSDVLDKVASEPMLLELEAEGTRENNTGTVDKNVTHSILDQNDSPLNEDSCFLHPGFLNGASNLLRFTVVDTSSVQGQAPSSFRKLRSLPVDKNQEMDPTHTTDTNRSVESQDHANVSSTNGEMLNSLTCDENEMGNIKIMAEETQNAHYHRDVHVPNENPKYKHGLDGEAKSLLDEQQMKIVKIQKNQVKSDKLTYLDEQEMKIVKIQKNQVKPDKLTYLSLASKRRKLAACTEVQSGCSSYSSLRKNCMKGETGHQLRSITDGLNDEPSKFLAKCKNSRMSVPRECSVILSNDYPLEAFVTKNVLSDEKSQEKVTIDLNRAQCSSDSYTSERDDDELTMISPFPLKKGQTQINIPYNEMPNEHNDTVNARRQGTRNRPPTTRVLEAVALGYLGSGQRIRSPRRAASKYSHSARKTADSSGAVNGSTSMQTNTVDTMDENCRRYTSETSFSSLLHNHRSNSNSYGSLGMRQDSDHGQTFTR